MDLFLTIIVVLVVLWILGFLFSFGGFLIHLLLVIALVIIVYRFFKGKNILTGK